MQVPVFLGTRESILTCYKIEDKTYPDISVSKMQKKRFFRWIRVSWIFSGEFRSISRAFQQEPVGNHRKKSKKFPVGILLPRSGDFRFFSAGTGPYFSTWAQYSHRQNIKNQITITSTYQKKKTTSHS